MHESSARPSVPGSIDDAWPSPRIPKMHPNGSIPVHPAPGQAASSTPSRTLFQCRHRASRCPCSACCSVRLISAGTLLLPRATRSIIPSRDPNPRADRRKRCSPAACRVRSVSLHRPRTTYFPTAEEGKTELKYSYAPSTPGGGHLSTGPTGIDHLHQHRHLPQNQHSV